MNSVALGRRSFTLVLCRSFFGTAAFRMHASCVEWSSSSLCVVGVHVVLGLKPSTCLSCSSVPDASAQTTIEIRATSYNGQVLSCRWRCYKDALLQQAGGPKRAFSICNTNCRVQWSSPVPFLVVFVLLQLLLLLLAKLLLHFTAPKPSLSAPNL